MRYSFFAIIAPCALLLSACTTVTPAYKDIGVRQGPCISGGPDDVAQAFYNYRIQHLSTGLDGLTALHPYLSDSLYATLAKDVRHPSAHQPVIRSDIYSSATNGMDSAEVASASTIPNTDARNIPLRVTFTKGSSRWQDEVLMIREGQCWAIDDVRYLGASNAPSGNLRQALGHF